MNGSSSTTVRQVAVAGSTGVSDTGSPGSRWAALAMATASRAVRSISPSSSREVAAKPQRPPTSTRMPTPVEVERSMPSISWLRTVSDSLSSVPARASAKSAPAARAASTAIFAMSSTRVPRVTSSFPSGREARTTRGILPGAVRSQPVMIGVTTRRCRHGRTEAWLHRGAGASGGGRGRPRLHHGRLRRRAAAAWHGGRARARAPRPVDRRDRRRPVDHGPDRVGPSQGVPRLLRPPRAHGSRGRREAEYPTPDGRGWRVACAGGKMPPCPTTPRRTHRAGRTRR